jgi:PhzF family phenazine biosynthesis protein
MTQDIPIYQVDAFASELFLGNPAAVCPLDDWLPDDVLQAIAAENNLSETAYFKARGEDYDLRWFTPVREVDLCGHATLGTAYVIANHFAVERDSFRFHTRSGVLEVRRDGEDFTMDFPTREGGRVEETDLIGAVLRNPVQEVWRGQDIMAVLASEAEVRALDPDMAELALLDTRGVIVTAAGETCDFVSRFFAPQSGVPEDPVTGSAHCMLTPYWAAQLGKTVMTARQLSKRGGELSCELRGHRVLITGRAVPYLEGRIRV